MAEVKKAVAAKKAVATEPEPEPEPLTGKASANAKQHEIQKRIDEANR
jgi:hypothetical protein